MQRTCPALPLYDPALLWGSVVLMAIFWSLLVSQAVLEYSGISMYGHIFTWCLRLKASLVATFVWLYERTWTNAHSWASAAASNFVAAVAAETTDTHRPRGLKVDQRNCDTLQQVKSQLNGTLENITKDIQTLKDLKTEFNTDEKVTDIRHDCLGKQMQAGFNTVSAQRNSEHRDDQQAEARNFTAMHVNPTADEVQQESQRVLRDQLEFNEEQKAFNDQFTRQFQAFKAQYRSAKCARQADHNNVVCALNAQYISSYVRKS